MKLEDILKDVYLQGLESPMDSIDDIVQQKLDCITKISYMRKLFAVHLRECFTSGYYGDAVLAEEYASSMSRMIFKRLGNLKNLLNIDKVLKNIPDAVSECITVGGGYLSGGGALRAILGGGWEGDWDIYCSHKQEASIVKLLQDKYKAIANTNPTYGNWDIVANDQKIQIIVVDSLQGAISAFDLTICQFSISRYIPCISGPDVAFSDLRKNLLRINPSLRSVNKDTIERRMEKYIARGFSCAPGTLETIKKLGSVSRAGKGFLRATKKQELVQESQPSFAVQSVPHTISGFSIANTNPATGNPGSLQNWTFDGGDGSEPGWSTPGASPQYVSNPYGTLTTPTLPTAADGPTLDVTYDEIDEVESDYGSDLDEVL
jgi:hypothetical protein